MFYPTVKKSRHVWKIELLLFSFAAAVFVLFVRPMSCIVNDGDQDPQNNWGTYGEEDDFDIFVMVTNDAGEEMLQHAPLSDYLAIFQKYVDACYAE